MWTCPLNHLVSLRHQSNRCLSSLYVSVVCPGTQNGLSSTGSQENQYNLIKDRYDGCEIIMGNLEITQIESNWDFSFLKVNSIPCFSEVCFLSGPPCQILSMDFFRQTSCFRSRVREIIFLFPPDNPRGDWLRPHRYEPLSGDSFRATTDH